MKQLFILYPSPHPARSRAIQAVQEAPDGWVVEIREPTRSLEQNALFHDICHAIAKSRLEWAGKKRTAAQWKVLLVSAHAVATKEGSELVPGLEGEFLNLRESTALMSVKRASSLIDYSMAFATTNGVKIEQPYKT